MIWGYFLGQPYLLDKQGSQEEVVKLHSRQGLALLAYLLEQGEEVSRAQLIELLWAEEEAPYASGSFRVMLSKIKKILPDALEITRYTVRLKPDAMMWDTLRFMQMAQQGDLDSLRQATSLYRGEFMQGFTLGGSAEFQTWLEEQRENWIESHNQVMRRLVDSLLDQRDMQRAIHHVDRWLKLEPWQERAHRQRMWLYWQTGEVDKALQHYRQYTRQLERELGAEPAEDTQKLYETILEDKKNSFQDLIRLRTASGNDYGAPLIQDPSEVYQLNTTLTSFVGRDEELDQLSGLLANNRLVTIRGTGGVGKTRLALQFAGSDFAKHYKDGVVFVALEHISETQLPHQIGRRLGLQNDEGTLFDYLKDKNMLLILDNFEHVLEARAFVMELLKVAPQISLLITSRETLGLMGEQRFILKGLTIPIKEDELFKEDLAIKDYSALKLFAERAALQDPSFRLNEENIPLVYAICRKLSGIPLAIELSASWLSVMTVEEVANELAINLDLLKTESANVIDRHQNMAEVFESSWQKLDGEQKEACVSLTDLPEHFDKEDIKQTKASLLSLRSLSEKSILEVDKQGGQLRYHFPSLLRSYAAARGSSSENN